jgi:hypothetical protein
MRLFASLLLASLSLFALGQAAQAPTRRQPPVRIPIRHADPWFGKAMLEGVQVRQPELSTILGFMGLPSRMGQTASTLIEGGRQIVNPTDNSLWFYPHN